MAAPVLQALGTPVSVVGAGTISPTWPTHAVDDIALLFIAHSAGNQGVALATAAGFVAVGGQQTPGIAGSRAALYWCRATSTSMPAPSTTAAAGAIARIAVIVTFRGCVNTGNPWDVTGGSSTAISSTTYTTASQTTTVIDTLVAHFGAHRTTGLSVTSPSNANLTGLSVDLTASAAAAAALSVITGVKATAGAIGATTATQTNCNFAEITVALVGATAGSVTGTSATTNADDTSAASGTVVNPVSGSSATTNANDTSSASGVVQINVSGSSATTNANDNSSASGVVANPVTGSSATTNANDTSSASGLVRIIGSSATTNNNDTSNASGMVLVGVTGSSNTTNANDTSQASGTVTYAQQQNTPGYLGYSYKRWLKCRKREEQEECLEALAEQRAIEVAQMTRDSSRKAIREETKKLLRDVADTRMQVNQTLQRVLKVQFEARVTAAIQQQIALEQEEEDVLLQVIAHFYD